MQFVWNTELLRQKGQGNVPLYDMNTFQTKSLIILLGHRLDTIGCPVGIFGISW